MILATWPSGAPEAVPARVEQIFGDIHPVPQS
jgi:hypothetical protein